MDEWRAVLEAVKAGMEYDPSRDNGKAVAMAEHEAVSAWRKAGYPMPDEQIRLLEESMVKQAILLSTAARDASRPRCYCANEYETCPVCIGGAT